MQPKKYWKKRLTGVDPLDFSPGLLRIQAQPPTPFSRALLRTPHSTGDAHSTGDVAQLKSPNVKGRTGVEPCWKRMGLRPYVVRTGYLDNNGFIHYTPAANYYGKAQFNYMFKAANDGEWCGERRVA